MNTDTVNQQEPTTHDQRTDDQRSDDQRTDGRLGSSRHPLRRCYDDRMLAGVASGVASYLNVDTVIVRIGFVVLTLIGGAGIPLYLAGLLLIPEEGSDVSIAGSIIDSLQHR
jgi:phage shock protein PspC (stress-responsive transcriptional regulator)